MSDFIHSLGKMPDPSLMKLWDKAAENFGIPENMLMENAGQGLFHIVDTLSDSVAGNIYILFMGGGNNGGDAACLARYLYDNGAWPYVFHLRPLENLKGACAWHVDLARKDGVKFISLNMDNPFDDMTAWLMLQLTSLDMPRPPRMMIDGLIGAGFAGTLKPGMESLINAINDCSRLLKCPVVAIDIPSGLDGVTGKPLPTAVLCKDTITLAAPKPGMLLPEASCCGTIHVCPIGLPEAIGDECPAFFRLLDGTALLYREDFPEESHKNTYGHFYVIGGSQGFEGAAHLACLAGLRTGAGLATACAPESSLPLIKNGIPEIMTEVLGSGNAWPDRLDEKTAQKLRKAGAIVIGPGLGLGAAKFLRSILELEERPPTVFDADALSLIAQYPELMKFVNEHDVLTPHPGEAARLLKCETGKIQADRREALRQLLEMAPCAVVLKGAGTILGQAGEPWALCPYDIPQMAIAGAGDVLAGCIAACLMKPDFKDGSSLDAAAYGVITHAIAGLRLAAMYPDRGGTASELADQLCEVKGFIKKIAENDPPENIVPWPNLY